MLCKICKKEAVVGLRSHNTAFCADCFIHFFSRQVERAIQKDNLIHPDDSVLIALSGGKDSLSLAYELKRQGYTVTGLHVDLGIPNSSEPARDAVERFCQKNAIPLLVEELSRHGLAIPEVKRYLRRPICSACGSVKRYFFNKVAFDRNFTVLATGHNLDDEVSRLFSNTLRWDTNYLSSQGPLLAAKNGFVRKVKPLWRLSEFEIANYAFLMGIENIYTVCPYSHGASFSYLKHLMQNLESKMPGRKMNFYQGFLARGKPHFAPTNSQASQNDEPAEKDTMPDELHPCASCGYPTSAEMYCGVCRIRQAIQEKKKYEEECSLPQ